MKTIYKAHILFTKEQSRFEVFENGYVAVENGKVACVASTLSDISVQCPAFDINDAEVVDFGNKLLIPATAFIGMDLALFCNLIARLPSFEGNLPINSVTALIGAPIVLWVIFHRQKVMR